jgi:hypothetical protein
LGFEVANKTALLNGRVYDPFKQTFEKTNILLIKNKIAGLGYIPDDDDSHQIDITDHYVFPNVIIPIIADNNHIELSYNIAIPDTLQLSIHAYTQLHKQIKDSKKNWHISLQDPNDIPLFNTLLEKGHAITLSIPCHLITKKTIQTLMPHIKSRLIQSICCSKNNQTQLFHCFPLLEDQITITDIHQLYSGNIITLCNTKLKGIALTHSPNLTIFNPKTGEIKHTILNGKFCTN